MPRPPRYSFSFRHQCRRGSKYGILLSYISQVQMDMTKKERILASLAAYWLPFAYQNLTDCTAEELRQLARSAIYQLKLHIHYLEESFGLNGHPVPEGDAEVEAGENLLSGNGWHRVEDWGRGEDFSDEDDILSQMF